MMEFSGEFELEDVPPEKAWVVLSDPIAVRNALKGCQYITPMDDDFGFDDYEPEEDVETLPEADPEDVAARAFKEGQEYAALMQVGVGSVKPRFETSVTIDERDHDDFIMTATGSGTASGSSFSMESGMQIHSLEDGEGSRIEWWTEADISGRIAQLGSRVIKPVANKIVGNFFSNIEQQMSDVEETDSSITDRIRGML
ncbi:CoxG family protein [Natronorubrum sulfidifaciens]|uniref:Carbon monoxide dehydrogenase subunit G n=1 Tax=Natronorubrum sulfidifaciens JCM 14089 TaxID=1230460 RepID=L9W6A5_9EURY|nr:SRPBCC domain-containing protein [Natronorubrum sulfidifaciens]ELY43868.1 carbon monoxide dehydrogenase subunit G [Natronorubrum sulfidifaciens JCM 14089]